MSEKQTEIIEEVEEVKEIRPVVRQKKYELSPKNEAEALLKQAIEKNVPIETIEKLLIMRRELKAEKAKEEYDKSMSSFQAECPVIKKTKKVYEKNSTINVRYSFAPLDSIVDQVKEILGKHGFSYTIKPVQDDKSIGVICRSVHKSGHSEDTSFTVPIGVESYMSDVQKYGARLTFCKRYAFCNAFGILTGDEDNDANEEKAKPGVAQKTTVAQPQATQSQPKENLKSSEKQHNFIKSLLKAKNYTEKELFVKYEVTSFDQLTSDQASTIITNLQKLKPKAPKVEAAEEPEADNPNPEFDLNSPEALEEIDKGIAAQN